MSYMMVYTGSVPTERKDDFVRHAREIAQMFRDLGATRAVECWGEDVPPGEVTSFPLAVKAEEGETVVVGWQEWPDKATRDAAWEKSREDPRMQAMQDMPIDGRRMIFAGFDTLIDV